FNNDYHAMRQAIIGYGYTDDQTRAAMQRVYANSGYIMDPHGAIGYLGLKDYFKEGKAGTGIFLETAHPAKFKDVVDQTLQRDIDIPLPLRKFMEQQKQSVAIENDFEVFKAFLI